MSCVDIITIQPTSSTREFKQVRRPAKLHPSSLRPSSSSQRSTTSSISTPLSSSIAPLSSSVSSSTASSSSSANMSFHRNPPPRRLTTNTSVAGLSPPSAGPFSPMPNTAQPTSSRPSRTVSEIIPRLYISDLSFAENPASLISHRITHIMSTMPDTIFRPPPSLLPVQPVRLQVRVEDLPFAELAAHLPTTTAWIRDALNSGPEARVLVHCAEGISRSVSVVAAFLMAAYGWSPLEALSYVKSKRKVAEPNFGFVQQLHEYARDALGRPGIVIPTQPQFGFSSGPQ